MKLSRKIEQMKTVFLNVQMILMQSINMTTQMEIGDTNSWD